jgi:hypothetical protein
MRLSRAIVCDDLPGDGYRVPPVPPARFSLRDAGSSPPQLPLPLPGNLAKFLPPALEQQHGPRLFRS